MKDKLDRKAVLKNKELFEKLNAGDKTVIKDILANNMDLVNHKVEQFKKGLKNPAAANEEDLRQEAMISLFKLIKSRPIFEDFRFRANLNIKRSLESFVEKQNKFNAADLYYEAPIAPGLPKLKDVATDEKSEYDMMIDREYSNGKVETKYLCADDRKFLNMISYASPKEIAKALNIPENRLVAIYEDIKKSIIEQRPSLLGYRYLIKNNDKLHRSHEIYGFPVNTRFLRSEKTAEICEYMINTSNFAYDIAEHFNVSRQRVDQIFETLAKIAKCSNASEILQQSKYIQL